MCYNKSIRKSIASLVTAKRNSELDTAAEEVMAVLREAQNYSLTGKSISSTCISYMVDFTNGSGNYNLTNGCALNQNYTLKNGVVVFSAIDTTFVAPHGDNSVPGSWRVITVSKGGTNIYVCINSAGLIKKSGNPFCT